jgi:hypothetical protein
MIKMIYIGSDTTLSNCVYLKQYDICSFSSMVVTGLYDVVLDRTNEEMGYFIFNKDS